MERKPLADRGTPDLVLALALIHHITIAANVPVREFVDWLASLGTSLVIEFPTREDPMVKKLLGPKREGLHPDYERENVRAGAGGGLRRRAPRAPEVGHAAAVLRPPQGRGQPDRPHRSRALMGGREAAPAPQEGGAAREAGRSPGWRGNLLAFGHLAVLSAFALAQPLFDLLSDNPEFFAARGSTGGEIIVFALLLVLAPPALLLADRAAGGPGRADALARSCTWSSSACWRPWCSCRRSRRRSTRATPC